MGSSCGVRCKRRGELDDGVSFSSWFGTTGWATASAVSVLDDGSILVAGDIWNGTAYRFAMARLTAAARSTVTLATVGAWLRPRALCNARANAIAVDPASGDITLAGFAGGSMAAAHYHSNGQLDTAFAQGGKLTVDLGAGADIAYGLTIDPLGTLAPVRRKGTTWRWSA